MTGIVSLAPPQGPGAGGAASWISGGRSASSVSASDAGRIIGDNAHVGWVGSQGIYHASSSAGGVVRVVSIRFLLLSLFSAVCL